MLPFWKKKKKKSAELFSENIGVPFEPEQPAAEPKYGYSGAVVSDVGCVRSNNEDNYLLGEYINNDTAMHSRAQTAGSVCSGVWFAGVFDGMGGGDMGELAARDTAAAFRDVSKTLQGMSTKQDIDRAVRKAFQDANNRVVELQKQYEIFGTTGTLLCFNGAEFKIYHLGDSRAYLMRDDSFLQLTQDQTLARMKLDAGLYTEENPAVEEDKHKLVEYIGRDRTGTNIKPVESRWIPVERDDCVLLCSDGLYDMCAKREIAAILWCDGTAEEKAEALVQKAIRNGGEDNITCMTVVFVDVDPKNK